MPKPSTSMTRLLALLVVFGLGACAARTVAPPPLIGEAGVLIAILLAAEAETGACEFIGGTWVSQTGENRQPRREGEWGCLLPGRDGPVRLVLVAPDGRE